MSRLHPTSPNAIPAAGPPPLDAPATIPRGVADHFWSEAANRRSLEERMLRLFRSWGYGDVLLPAFEYLSTLERGASEEFLRDLYRLTDRDGSALALRADMTIAVARLVATRLHDAPMPQRYCYSDSIFRHGEPRAGRQREFLQSGVELIGAAEPAADAEVLALAAQTMRIAGLPATRIAVGHLGYFNALMQGLNLAPDASRHLIRAIDANSDAELGDFLRKSALTDAQRHTVTTLAHLSGENPTEILERAREISLNAAMIAALDNLEAVLAALNVHTLDNAIFVDLTEIHNLGYYTGITFEVLAPGLGFPVASGGRYDNLVGSFGAPQPAVGAAFMVESILLAARLNKGGADARPVEPHALINTAGAPEAQKWVERWRADGGRIVVDLGDNHGESLRAAADARNAMIAMEWVGDGFLAHFEPYGAAHFSETDADAMVRGHIHRHDSSNEADWSAQP